MTTIVIDASFALALVIPLDFSSRAQHLMQRWTSAGASFDVPSLWGYEVVSGLGKAVAAGVLTPGEAIQAIEVLWSLDVVEIQATASRHQRALDWAARLGHTAAYDSQYLVVAEDLKAEFWTADRRLSEPARSLGVNWVHWIGRDADA